MSNTYKLCRNSDPFLVANAGVPARRKAMKRRPQQDELTERDVKKGQKHKVFEDSFDAKPIYHRNFLLQKVNYIHLNCIRGKWKLAEHWEDYE